VDVQPSPRAPQLKSGASSTRDSQEGGVVGIPLRTNLSTTNLPRVQITRSMQQSLTVQIMKDEAIIRRCLATAADSEGGVAPVLCRLVWLSEISQG